MKDPEQVESRNRLRLYEAECERLPDPIELEEIDERPISRIVSGFYRQGTLHKKSARADTSDAFLPKNL